MKHADSGQLSGAELEALRRAVALAARGGATVRPNPVVGCVLLAPGGTTVGQGFHQLAGGPHAEIHALATAGANARGSIAVVTLEPCNHTGRTGPCSEALIAADVSRVVVAVRDPWSAAAGGIERLRAAGIDVAVVPEILIRHDTDEKTATELAALHEAAEDVNRVWLTAVRQQRPFVTFKAGVTLDGRVAAADGTSRWISSAQSRADVHQLRAGVDTVMVGIGTVLADDPQLTARGADGTSAGPQPLRVVIDSQGRTPSVARVLDGAADTWIATVAEFGADADGRVQLAAVLTRLYQADRRHVLLEGGPRLTAAMLDAGLVDEILLYVAPLVLGAGRQVVEGGAVATLADAHRAELRDVTRLGPDVRLRYRIRSES